MSDQSNDRVTSLTGQQVGERSADKIPPPAFMVDQHKRERERGGGGGGGEGELVCVYVCECV